jgi:hypothetical protein
MTLLQLLYCGCIQIRLAALNEEGSAPRCGIVIAHINAPFISVMQLINYVIGCLRPAGGRSANTVL